MAPNTAKVDSDFGDRLSVAQELESSIKKLLNQLQKGKGKVTDKTPRIVQTIQKLLHGYQKDPRKVEVEVLLAVANGINDGGRDVCDRMDPTTFCVILDVILQADSYINAHRGIHLLASSLIPETDDPDDEESMQARKDAIGNNCIHRLILYITNTDNDRLMRRRAGILCTHLVRGSEKNLCMVEDCPEHIRRGLGQLILNEPDEILRVISSQLIKTIVEAGIDIRDLWPEDIDRKFYLEFPTSSISEETWVADVQKWFNLLRQGPSHMPPEKQVGLMLPIEKIHISPMKMFGGSHQTAVIFVDKEVASIMALPTNGGLPQLLDITSPLFFTSAKVVVDDSSQVQSVQITLQILPIDTEDVPQIFLDAAEIELDEIMLIMEMGAGELMLSEIKRYNPLFKISQAEDEERSPTGCPSNLNSSGSMIEAWIQIPVGNHISHSPTSKQVNYTTKSFRQEGNKYPSSVGLDPLAHLRPGRQIEGTQPGSMSDFIDEHVNSVSICRSPKIIEDKAGPSLGSSVSKQKGRPGVKPKAKPPIQQITKGKNQQVTKPSVITLSTRAPRNRAQFSDQNTVLIEEAIVSHIPLPYSEGNLDTTLVKPSKGQKRIGTVVEELEISIKAKPRDELKLTADKKKKNSKEKAPDSKAQVSIHEDSTIISNGMSTENLKRLRIPAQKASYTQAIGRPIKKKYSLKGEVGAKSLKAAATDLFDIPDDWVQIEGQEPHEKIPKSLTKFKTTILTANSNRIRGSKQRVAPKQKKIRALNNPVVPVRASRRAAAAKAKEKIRNIEHEENAKEPSALSIIEVLQHVNEPEVNASNTENGVASRGACDIKNAVIERKEYTSTSSKLGQVEPSIHQLQQNDARELGLLANESMNQQFENEFQIGNFGNMKDRHSTKQLIINQTNLKRNVIEEFAEKLDDMLRVVSDIPDEPQRDNRGSTRSKELHALNKMHSDQSPLELTTMCSPQVSAPKVDNEIASSHDFQRPQTPARVVVSIDEVIGSPQEILGNHIIHVTNTMQQSDAQPKGTSLSTTESTAENRSDVMQSKSEQIHNTLDAKNMHHEKGKKPKAGTEENWQKRKGVVDASSPSKRQRKWVDRSINNEQKINSNALESDRKRREEIISPAKGEGMTDFRRANHLVYDGAFNKTSMISFSVKGSTKKPDEKASIEAELEEIDIRKRKWISEVASGTFPRSPPKKRQHSSPPLCEQNGDAELPYCRTDDNSSALRSRRNARSRLNRPSSQASRVDKNGSPVAVWKVDHITRLSENPSQSINLKTYQDQESADVVLNAPDKNPILTFTPKARVNIKNKMTVASPMEVISRYIPHERTAHGYYRGIQSQEVVAPQAAIADPFAESTENPTSFIERLRRTASRDVQNQIGELQGQLAGINNSLKSLTKAPKDNTSEKCIQGQSILDSRWVEDPEKTLVEPTQLDRHWSPANKWKGRIPESRTSTGTATQIPEGELSRERWNLALRPHYTNSRDALHRIADEAIIRLSNAEDRMELVVRQYNENCNKIIDNMGSKREVEKSKAMKKLETRSKQMKIAYTEAKDFIQARVDGLKESTVAQYEISWREKQDEVQSLIEGGVASLSD